MKTIIITGQKTILAIGEEFSAFFPFLRLELFSKPLKSMEKSLVKPLKIDSKSKIPLKEYSTNQSDRVIAINKEMTVAELENQLSSVFGLGMKIFRNSGKIWLETTLTENWSLEEQNRQGKELSS